MASRSTSSATLYYESLRTMVRAGLPLGRALSLVVEKTGGAFGAALAGLERGVQGGTPLHEGMARFPDQFPPLEQALVRAGEDGGRLEESLGEILKILYRQRDARNQMIQAAIYPLILVHATILVPAVVTWYLKGLAAYLAVVLPALAMLYGFAGIAWFVNSRAKSGGAFGAAWDGFKLRVPWTGGIHRRTALARFARCLGALNRSGLPVFGALEHSLRAVGNEALRARLARAVRGVEDGQTLSEAIVATGAYPREVDAILETGEQSGAMDTCLERTADLLDDEAAHSLAKLSKILPILLLLAAMAFGAMQILSQAAETFRGLHELPH